MRILEAEEELVSGAPDSRVYDLVLAITGSEEKASAALTERIEARHRRNERPEV